MLSPYISTAWYLRLQKKVDPCDHTWISQGEGLQLHSSWADLLITCDEGVSRGKALKPHVADCCKLQWAAHICPTIVERTWSKHGQYRRQTCMGFMWVPCGYLERQNTWAHMENCCILQCAPLMAAHEWPMRCTHLGPSWGKWNFAIWGKFNVPNLIRHWYRIGRQCVNYYSSEIIRFLHVIAKHTNYEYMERATENKKTVKVVKLVIFVFSGMDVNMFTSQFHCLSQAAWRSETDGVGSNIHIRWCIYETLMVIAYYWCSGRFCCDHITYVEWCPLYIFMTVVTLIYTYKQKYTDFQQH